MNRLTPDLRVIEANTRFAGLLRDPASLDLLFGQQDQVPTLVALNEVAPGRRHLAETALRAYNNFSLVFPEGSNLDTVWAVSNDLRVESTVIFPLRSSMQGLGGIAMGDRRRGVGVHAITVTTPSGQRVLASQQHLSPPVLEPLRRKQARGLYDVLATEEPFAGRDDGTLGINVGDNNHFFFSRFDRRLQELFQSLCDGSGTCDIYRAHPKLAKWLERCGMVTRPQLDAVYGQPPLGTELIPTDTPRAGQIGYATTRIWEVASDHAATQVDFYFPQAVMAGNGQQSMSA